MTEAQKILGMIEAVDPKDAAKLDEIDARVCAYLRGREYRSHSRAESLSTELFGWLTVDIGNSEFINFWSSHTRSRDALKAIRPGGHRWSVTTHREHGIDAGASAWCMTKHSMLTLRTPVCPTEELAELHAIIQAIDFERRGK